MKIVFFLVVLANITLFLWEYNRSVRQPADKQYETVASSEREVIVLARELKKGPKPEMVNGEESQNSPAAGSESAIENAVSNNSREGSLNPYEPDLKGITRAGEKDSVYCYQAGPFAAAELISLWRSRLNSSGAQVELISRTEKIIRDYVVYYPAADKVEELEANVEMLKSHGLNEFWIKRTGEEKGQILLGIFSREERALKMKNELQAKGINAELKLRYQNKANRYALIRTEEKTLDSLDNLKRAYPAIPVKPLAGSSENCQVDSAEEGSQSSDNLAATELKNESVALTSPAVKGEALSESDRPGPGRESKKNRMTAQTSNHLNGLQTCYKVGPFADNQLLQRWDKDAAADGLKIKPLTLEEKAVSDYLVYYPAAKTTEQSAVDMQMLKHIGLTDVWMVGKGEERGKISLGVFGQEQRAVLMKNQLRAKGVNAEIKPRYKTRSVKYLMVEGGSKVKYRLKKLEKNYPGLMASPVQNCLGFKFGN
ncbi:MAG: hypothetical protein ACU84H_16205 [Gammaproteobacteria bacterium]